MKRVRLLTGPFDVGNTLTRFKAAQSTIGAVVTFSGIVRDETGALQVLEIECFEAMAQKSLEHLCARAIERFELADALIIHRHGRLAPGETIMMVATASAHRQAAFDGAAYLMDDLKSRAPFWKKEISRDAAHWVAAQQTDETALARWSDETADRPLP
ncbi:MAG: molybdenum cofactor biosynthesis protein MoaE [Pseudomonadota bacterium]